MTIPIVPKLLRAHLSDLAANNSRIDGRLQWEGRNLEIEHSVLPRAEGSARVRMGDTIVLAGVKFQIMQPYPDRPNQGGLMCSADVRPIAGRNWEAGPPSPEAIELGRVVDRGIRESGCIDVDSLCIIPGEKAWQVILDLFAVSDDGNLFDRCPRHQSCAHITRSVDALSTMPVQERNLEGMRGFTSPLETMTTSTPFRRV